MRRFFARLFCPWTPLYVFKQVAEKIAWPEFKQTFLPIGWFIAGCCMGTWYGQSVPKSFDRLRISRRQGLVSQYNRKQQMDGGHAGHGWRKQIRNQVTQRLHSKDLVDGPRSFAVRSYQQLPWKKAVFVVIWNNVDALSSWYGHVWAADFRWYIIYNGIKLYNYIYIYYIYT